MKPLTSSRSSYLLGRRFLQRLANSSQAARRGRPEEVSIPLPAEQGGVLCRDFIHDALYSAQAGYFGVRGSNVIISMDAKERIDFKKLRGYWDYQLELDRLYKSRKEAWLTPVEIFAPHYSNAIARYIIRKFRDKQNAPQRATHARHQRSRDPSVALAGASRPKRLVIYEFGGGYGTNARCILDFIRAMAPDLYNKMKYTIVEISRPLAGRQCERVHPEHEGVCDVVLSDALTWTQDRARARQDNPEVDEECFVLALEVLDNLPHDKVLWVPKAKAKPQAKPQAIEGTQPQQTPQAGDGGWELHEAIVRGSGSAEDPYYEASRPLSDDLLSLVLRVKPSLARRVDPNRNASEGGWKHWVAHMLNEQMGPIKGPHAAFVPTGLAKLLEGVCQAFPRHNLIIADFDSLPPPTVEDGKEQAKELKDLEAWNAPLVTSRDPTTGAHIDHPSYVSNKGRADIFFPVDFATLRDLHRFFAGREDRTGGLQQSHKIVKSSEFMKDHAALEQTATRSGYNPLLEDFLNTAFFLTEFGAPQAKSPLALQDDTAAGHRKEGRPAGK